MGNNIFDREERQGRKADKKTWGPFSLLSVDVKIASKAMALRIKQVIHKLIQTAYIHGRNIGE